MRNKIIAMCFMLLGPVICHSAESRLFLPLDSSLHQIELKLKPGQVAYGWELMPWNEWLKRPTSGPLMISTTFDKTKIEIFEARAAAIVQKPATYFTEELLHNIETLRKLEPSNRYTQIPGPHFSVETQIPFPSEWSKLIRVGKETKLLDEKTTDDIQMQSVFIYASQKSIADSPDLQKKIQLLDDSTGTAQALNLQGATKINQIANFMSMATVFYKINDSQTLIVNHTAVAIKKNVLDMGGFSGLKLDGRSILLGKSAILNSDKGIGAGLPKYYLELFENMIRGLN